jgi:hypothetical protein
MISAELMLNPPNRRQAASRADVDAPGAIEHEAGHRSLCRIGNISASGARLTLFDEIDRRVEIELRLPNGVVRRARIVWVDDLECGCAFDEPLSQEIVDALAGRFGADAAEDPLFKRGHA